MLRVTLRTTLSLCIVWRDWAGADIFGSSACRPGLAVVFGFVTPLAVPFVRVRAPVLVAIAIMDAGVDALAAVEMIRSKR